MHPRYLLWPFTHFVLSIALKSKENIPAYPLVTLQRNWEGCGVTLLQLTSSLTKRRRPGCRKNMKRIHTELKERPMWGKRSHQGWKKSKKK
ncbi:unnamed protein product [Gulo gulo]|uniref:Uncharacterized protein n=1 Tax=Gulo gulo TaxID=48420 RepID=A0A9X9Q6X1_GULGU|nr:unnamed protein product [Gulo gulo]